MKFKAGDVVRTKIEYRSNKPDSWYSHILVIKGLWPAHREAWAVVRYDGVEMPYNDYFMWPEEIEKDEFLTAARRVAVRSTTTKSKRRKESAESKEK